LLDRSYKPAIDGLLQAETRLRAMQGARR